MRSYPVQIAYATQYDPTDISRWSGTVQYISKSLQQQGLDVHHVGPLREGPALLPKVKQLIYRRLLRRGYLRNRELPTLRRYATQITQQLAHTPVDVIFSPESLPTAYLQHQKPIVFWTDASFAGMVNYYPRFMNLCQESLANGHAIEQQALDNCQLAIYSSEWAANSAIAHYRVDPQKVKVVPFGANLDRAPDLEHIKAALAQKSTQHCNLLFIGVDWVRKGGDIALQVATELNQQGLPTTLTVVGCEPQIPQIPDFVRPLGFISKASSEGMQLMQQLLGTAHFLIVPSQAECYGLVFCEANAFGVPCLATHSGGIPTIVKPGVNGMTFAPNATITEYCTYIQDLFAHYSRYQDLALSSFHEYQSRLNWQVASQTVKSFIQDLL
jgi:glycosyltransferase involved in cell wall biosynthesis